MQSTSLEETTESGMKTSRAGVRVSHGAPTDGIYRGQ
jgi:hypothetical protein